jgi:hypothetical protein
MPSAVLRQRLQTTLQQIHSCYSCRTQNQQDRQLKGQAAELHFGGINVNC